MRANPLLVLSSAAYAVAGIALVFAPQETLSTLAVAGSPTSEWLAQAFGAALLGFAWLNWLQRPMQTGGIYGRTVVLPNLIFVLTAALSAWSAWRRDPSRPLLLAALAFGLLAIAFGSRLYARGPVESGS